MRVLNVAKAHVCTRALHLLIPNISFGASLDSLSLLVCTYKRLHKSVLKHNDKTPVPLRAISVDRLLLKIARAGSRISFHFNDGLW